MSTSEELNSLIKIIKEEEKISSTNMDFELKM